MNTHTIECPSEVRWALQQDSDEFAPKTRLLLGQYGLSPFGDILKKLEKVANFGLA